MNTAVSRHNCLRIYRILRRFGVSDRMIVPFLLKLRKSGVCEAAGRVGLSKHMLYKALSGDRHASERVREALERELGFDVWQERERREHEQ